MRKLKKSEYVLAGILAFVSAFPLAAGQIPFPDVPLQGTVATTEGQQALDNYANYRQGMRDYQHAMQICIQLRAQGQQITCPDVNDYDGIHRMLSGNYNTSPMHAAAPNTTLRMSDLTSYQQGLIRWYQRIHSCPDSLKDYYLAGFYDLCFSMIQTAPAIDTTKNLHQGVSRDQAPASLDQIINANQAPTRN
jgi:hypothetical protein